MRDRKDAGTEDILSDFMSGTHKSYEGTDDPGWKTDKGFRINLITPAELKLLPKGTELYDIFGYGPHIVGEHRFDLDTRAGYLAYGLKVKS